MFSRKECERHKENLAKKETLRRGTLRSRIDSGKQEKDEAWNNSAHRKHRPGSEKINNGARNNRDYRNLRNS
jgi:hypothetical protein